MLLLWHLTQLEALLQHCKIKYNKVTQTFNAPRMLPNPLVTHLRGIKFSQVITASERRALIRKLICSNEDFALKF